MSIITIQLSPRMGLAKKKRPTMADKKFIEEVVKAHNEYRSRHQVPSLSHSKDLSTSAQKWADHLAATNTFQHSQTSHKGEPLGENIAMKWSSRPDDYSGQEVTDQWYSEIKMFQFGGEPRSLNSGHFTQVVWKGSKEVGVGKAQTGDGKIIVVAVYRPAGNMIGDYTKNVFPPKDGKIVIKKRADETPIGGLKEKPGRHVFRQEVREGPGHQVVSHEFSGEGGPFSSRFDNFFNKGSSFPSHGSASSDSFSKAESRSVRTYTVTEGVGANKVTKTITEETITKPDGQTIVNRKETVTSGGSGGAFADKFNDNCRIGRSPFKDSGHKDKKHRSKSSSSSDSSKEDKHRSAKKKGKQKKPQKMGDFVDSLVKAHNKVRSKHGVSDLKHNKDLTKYAQKWADQLASTGTFEHSQCLLNDERLGENIACKWGSGEADYTGEEVAEQWYSELSKHDFSSQKSTGSGHFTQMVWKGSKEIGAGKAKSSDGKVIVVASYRPPGNMIGSYLENVFPLNK